MERLQHLAYVSLESAIFQLENSDQHFVTRTTFTHVTNIVHQNKQRTITTVNRCPLTRLLKVLDKRVFLCSVLQVFQRILVIDHLWVGGWMLAFLGLLPRGTMKSYAYARCRQVCRLHLSYL